MKLYLEKERKNAILKTLLSDFNNDDIDLRPSKIGNLDVIEMHMNI